MEGMGGYGWGGVGGKGVREYGEGVREYGEGGGYQC